MPQPASRHRLPPRHCCAPPGTARRPSGCPRSVSDAAACRTNVRARARQAPSSPWSPQKQFVAFASAALHDSPSLATSPASSSTPAAPCRSGRPLGRSSAAGTSTGRGSHPGSPLHAGSRIRSDTPGGHFVDALAFCAFAVALVFRMPLPTVPHGLNAD